TWIVQSQLRLHAAAGLGLSCISRSLGAIHHQHPESRHLCRLDICRASISSLRREEVVGGLWFGFADRSLAASCRLILSTAIVSFAMVSLSLATSAAVAGAVGVVGVVVSAADFGIGAGGIGGSCFAAGKTKAPDMSSHSTNTNAAAATSLSKPIMEPADVGCNS